MSGNPFAGFTRSMRHRDYRDYTIASFTSLVGTWMHKVAMGWLTWEITNSYAWLGIVTFADLFAMMLCAPFAGALADRVDRLKIAFWAQHAMMWQAIVLAVLVYTGLATIWLVFGLAIVLGIMHAYHTTSRLALVPNLVPREDLTPAIALNSMIFNVARFIGPALAGIVIANFGVGPAFLLNVASFIVFQVVLARIEITAPEKMATSDDGMFAKIREGVVYAARHPGIGPMLLILAATAFTGRALPDLMPGFADGVFQRGPEGLAWLASAMGLGASLSGFYFLAKDGVRGMTSFTLHNVLLMGVATLAFVTLDSFWAGAVFLVAVGFAMNNTSIGTLNLMQNAVEGRLRGRVMSTYTVILQGGPALGTAVLGIAAEFAGLLWPVGVSAAFGVLLWIAILPRIGRIRDALEADPLAREDGQPDEART